jgi:hypothetical protein
MQQGRLVREESQADISRIYKLQMDQIRKQSPQNIQGKNGAFEFAPLD